MREWLRALIGGTNPPPPPTERIGFTEAELAVIEFRPGDTPVLMFPHSLSVEQVRSIKDTWERCYPDLKVLVLDSGARLGVIRAVEVPHADGAEEA